LSESNFINFSFNFHKTLITKTHLFFKLAGELFFNFIKKLVKQKNNDRFLYDFCFSLESVIRLELLFRVFPSDLEWSDITVFNLQCRCNQFRSLNKKIEESKANIGSMCQSFTGLRVTKSILYRSHMWPAKCLN
jgi:hypothetical protein